MKNSTIVQQPDLLELVFAGKNQSYGAYVLRRSYPGHLGRALGIGFLMIVSFSYPVFLTAIKILLTICSSCYKFRSAKHL